MHETVLVVVTGDVVARRLELFRNRGVRDDNAENGGSVIGSYEDEVRRSPNSTIVGRDS